MLLALVLGEARVSSSAVGTVVAVSFVPSRYLAGYEKGWTAADCAIDDFFLVLP